VTTRRRTTRPGTETCRLTRRLPQVPASLTLLLVVTIGATGCAGAEQTGPPAARVMTWVRGAAGGTAIGTVKVDSRNVGYALARHDQPAAIRTVCALLTNDAETAIGNLPTPDGTLTTDLNTAYGEAAAAGDDCYKGADGSPALLRRSARERVALVRLLTVAVDRIQSVTGQTPTTATTAPQGNSGDPFGGN